MICKLCKNEREGVRAHIIPESLHPIAPGPNRTPLHVTTDIPDQYPRRSPTGEYDSELVCADCEAIFAPWDNYIFRFLNRDVSEYKTIVDDGKSIAHIVPEANYKNLKLFFISLLWRASETTRPLFQAVNVGPHVDRLAEMIRDADRGDENEYATFLERFDNQKLGAAILNPHTERIDGINFTRFYLGGHIAHIKVDSRPVPKFDTRIMIQDGRQFPIFISEFDNSREHRIMRKLVKEYLN